MQYALINNIRNEAISNVRGTCEMCGADMIAKCGPRVIHHWAHASRQNCDPWHENETEWHRNWKNLFPANCREVVHTAPDGEIHRADIKTSTGIIIEIQHSPMSDEERASRENFYQNLVWVIDGSTFVKNFDLLHLLPDPGSDLAKDIVWFKGKRHFEGSSGGLFWRRSENPNWSEENRTIVGVYGLEQIELEVKSQYRGHHQYDWVKPRKTWLSATCPVYIDFGDEYLVRLEIYDESNLPCVRLISKKKFLHDAITETSVHDIATKFYPIK